MVIRMATVLTTLYEYYADTHPLVRDSDNDGLLDSEEDRDLDQLTNIDEQTISSRTGSF